MPCWDHKNPDASTAPGFLYSFWQTGMGKHPTKYIVQPGPFVDVMGLAGGKKGVDYGSPLRSIIISAELAFHSLEVFVHYTPHISLYRAMLTK